MIPSNLPRDLMALDLSRNSLDVKQLRQYLCQFKSLQSLSLSFADITSLSDILRGCSSVLELNLTGNRLLQVDSKTFLGLENLRRLLGLEVESIASKDAFKGLGNLKDLDLIFHGSTLPEGLFDNMVIQGLNLILTQATFLPQGIFEFGKKTLNSLQLVGENVATLSEDLLDDLCVLSKLFLVMPSVKTLPEHFFQSQKQNRQQNTSMVCPGNLQEVEITGIQTLPAKLFNQLANLETLQLQKIGRFPQMGFLAEVVNLRMLVITGSSLTHIPAAWFKQLYSLKTLKLSGVQLENLHENAFRGLINLNYLDLSYNNLQQITGTMLKPLRKTLETLILSRNSLTQIGGDCMSGLYSLRFIDVSENWLTNVYADSFLGMTYLSALYLNKNRLTSLPTDIFRDQLQLESLSVADNYLVEFPKAILKLKNSLVNMDLSSNELREVPASELCQFVYLEYVNIMGNSLHCDCRLLAFQQCPQISVEGQCKTPERYFEKYLTDIEVPKSCATQKQPTKLSSAPQMESLEPSLFQSVPVVPKSRQPQKEDKSPDQTTSIPESDDVRSNNPGKPNNTVIRELFTQELGTFQPSDKKSAASSGDNSSPKPTQKEPVPINKTMTTATGVSNSNQKLDSALNGMAIPKAVSPVQQNDSVDMQRQRDDAVGSNKDMKATAPGSLGVSEVADTQNEQQQPDAAGNQPDLTATEGSGSETAQEDQNPTPFGKANTGEPSKATNGKTDKVSQEDVDMASHKNPNSSEDLSASALLHSTDTPGKSGTEVPQNPKNGTGTFEPNITKSKTSEAEDSSANSEGESVDDKMMGDVSVEDSSSQSQQVVDGNLKDNPKTMADEAKSFRPAEDAKSKTEAEGGSGQSGSSLSKPSTLTQETEKSMPAQRIGDTTSRSSMKDASADDRLAGANKGVQTAMPQVHQNDSTDTQRPQGDGAVGSNENTSEHVKGTLGVSETEATQKEQEQPDAAGVQADEAAADGSAHNSTSANTDQSSSEEKISETDQSTDTQSKPSEDSQNQRSGTVTGEPSFHKKNISDTEDSSSASSANGSMVGGAPVQETEDQSQPAVGSNLKNKAEKTADESKPLTSRVWEHMKIQTQGGAGAGQSGNSSSSKPPSQTPGKDEATSTEIEGDPSGIITVEDELTPEGQEIGNDGKNKNGQNPQTPGKPPDKAPEKIAFNFTISALAALFVFGCSLLAIYGVRRWQKKGAYIISSRCSGDTEMNTVGTATSTTEESSDSSELQECDCSTPPSVGKPFN